MSNKSPLKTQGFLFALEVVNLYKELSNKRKEFVMSKQLLRSGTSIGANIREGQNAESKADFVHKLSIAQKECDESLYWLELLKESRYIDQTEFISLNDNALSLLRMIRSAIITTKTKYLNTKK